MEYLACDLLAIVTHHTLKKEHRRRRWRIDIEAGFIADGGN